MTTIEKQKTIAEQSVYGDLKAIVNKHFNADLILGIDQNGVTLKYANGEYPITSLNAVKPVLRPRIDLTKEITHKGYNEDKPFIPLVELAKVSYGYSHNDLNSTGVVLCGDKPYTIQSHFAENDISGIGHFDLLHLWHFDTRNLIERGDAIDVNTLEVNPYEV